MRENVWWAYLLLQLGGKSLFHAVMTAPTAHKFVQFNQCIDDQVRYFLRGTPKH